MKYIITQSQYNLISEGLPMRVKRRLDLIKDYIRIAISDFPNPCNQFVDEFDYADNLISMALDAFLTEDEEIMNSIGEDYDDIHSELVDMSKDLYGEELLDNFKKLCSDEN